jgi:hypothetical protein
MLTFFRAIKSLVSLQCGRVGLQRPVIVSQETPRRGGLDSLPIASFGRSMVSSLSYVDER